MPLVACIMQRKESILCAYGGVCMCMCVCVCVCVCVCEYMDVFLCCMWVYGYVYMYIVSVYSEWWIQIYKYMCQ